MKHYIIEPRDPSIHRDGKAFDATPGARATSLDFPPPSATAGAIRTLAGNWVGSKEQLQQQAADMRKLSVAGPLLVELNADGAVTQWLLPAPADAALLRVDGDEHAIDLRQLRPQRLDGAVTAMPDGLMPVQMADPSEKKAFGEPPRYWHKERYWQWLLAPKYEQKVAPDALGIAGPTFEQRVHVSITPETQTAEEGALFVTQGREYTARAQQTAEQRAQRHKPSLSDARRLALLVRSDAEICAGLHPFGGERRLAAFRTSTEPFPELPQEVLESIASTGGCRVILLTPALFAGGYKPKWLLETRHGVTPKLSAAAVKRPQYASGWDFEHNQPKVGRRMAPAGSVYWLALDGTAGARREWAKHSWMQCISDDEQDRLDGFGLAALGTWQEVAQ